MDDSTKCDTASRRTDPAPLIRLASAFALAALLTGCAGLYFESAGPPPQPPPRYSLETLPFQEYWTGLVFNGAKIGFTHLQVKPTSATNSGFRVQGAASMHFRFLGVDKKVTLKSDDRVAPDLSLRVFHYQYELDGTRLEINGRVQDARIHASIKSADTITPQSLEVTEKIFPTSVITLYPVIHGLEVGRTYRYKVYDGETRSVAEVEQQILGYERSELFPGEAFKLRTRLHGQEVDTWIDASGRPLLEMSMGGIFISELESESTAKRYLTLAALNKNEALLSFSRVPGSRPIPAPRTVKRLKVALSGLEDFEVPSDALQRCAGAASEIECEIRPDARSPGPAAAGYLASTLTLPSRDPRIRRLAGEIAAGRTDDAARASALVAWIGENIAQEAVDVFSALDVLQSRKAECQGNTYLYAALARALNIPTRVVNGIVYSELTEGFLYHTWAESHLNGAWVPVDPTFGQPVADATHIKLLEGESLADLGPLTRFMGRIQARVLEVEY